MNVDIGTLMYNMDLDVGGGTPSWGSELGQSLDHKLNDKINGDFAKALLFNAVPDIYNVSVPLGKGGSRQADYEYVIASLFKKIYVNGTLIPDACFMLVIVKCINSKTEQHIGRRTIKYNEKLTYQGQSVNGDCIAKIKNVFNLNDKSAWFISEMNTENQDELHFVLHIVDKDNRKNFYDTSERKRFVQNIIEKKEKRSSANQTHGHIVEENAKKGNYIYYGIPGCGKSYYVLNKWRDHICQRTTFYPDYTNSDFVGQVMPGLDENRQPTYEFVEGPFTKSLIDAFNHPDEDVALIIEELNRGNAAAIFGEIFQLLDRDENGKSQYTIYNPNIIKELNRKVFKKPNGVDFGAVYIPSNLTIVATMNTSDQNVYPLDTAFQRRWKFEKIRNSFLKEGLEPDKCNLDDENNYVSKKAYSLAKMFIPGTSTTWRSFVEKINDEITSLQDPTFSSEDKKIGVYFLSEDELTEKKDAVNAKEAKKMFSEKILKYIWEDIAKMDSDSWFDDCKTMDEVFEKFSKDGLKVFKNIEFEEDISEE